MQVSLEYCNSLSLLLLSTPSVQNPAAAAVAALFPAGVFDQSMGPCSESMRPPTTSVDGAFPRPHGRWSRTPVLSGKVVAGPLRRLELFGGSSKGRWMHGTAAEADEDDEQRPGTTRCWDIALSPTNIDEYNSAYRSNHTVHIIYTGWGQKLSCHVFNTSCQILEAFQNSFTDTQYIHSALWWRFTKLMYITIHQTKCYTPLSTLLSVYTPLLTIK